MNRFFRADWHMWPRHRSHVISWWGLDEYYIGHDNEHFFNSMRIHKHSFIRTVIIQNNRTMVKSSTFIQIHIYHQTSVMNKNIPANAWALTMCVSALCMYLCTYTYAKVCTRLHVTFSGETKEHMQNLRCIIANYVSLIKCTGWKFEYFLSFWFLARKREKCIHVQKVKIMQQLFPIYK